MEKAMKISENFNRSEFACQCGCGFDACDLELIACLEDIRHHFEIELLETVYIIITSGNRCQQHNRKVGGAKRSMHVKAKAVDFKVFKKNNNEQVDSNYIYNQLCGLYPDTFGIGKYNGRTHFDIRPNKARWDKTS